MEIIDKRERQVTLFRDVKLGQVFSSGSDAVWLRMQFDEAVDLRDGRAADFEQDDGCFVLNATLTIS